MMKIDTAFNAKLMEVVEKFPVLHNFKLKGYNNRNVVDREWVKVAKEVNESENTRKLFLLSLQSDDEMTAAQFQLFKRKVELLVEEIRSADDELSLPSHTSSLRTSSFHSAEFYTHTSMSPSPRSSNCSTGISPLHYSTYSSTTYNPTTPAHDRIFTSTYQYNQPGQFRTIPGSTDFFSLQKLDLTAPQRANT
ncbi:hypothetical protein PGB90_002775 [Kerria lacca]